MKQAYFLVFAAIFAIAACSGGGGGGNNSAPPPPQANVPPTIVSAVEAVFPQTRTGTVYTIAASDPNGDTLTYSISGTDAGSFSVNPSSGDVTFINAPDVDAPGSIDGDNFYFIDVTATDPSSASATIQVLIEVARYDPEGPFVSSDGAVFIGPDTIVQSDPSTFQSLTFVTTTTREVEDVRPRTETDAEVHVFDALYANGQQIEMVVNAELGEVSAAESWAQRLSFVLGQLDPIVVAGVQTVWIHAGNEGFFGPVSGIIAYTGSIQEFERLGALEEVMAHEATHATLDPIYLSASEWLQAQKSDVTFISEYARDFPETEDLAETYGAYLVVKNPDRNAPSLVRRVENGIPARIAFLESLGL